MENNQNQNPIEIPVPTSVAEALDSQPAEVIEAVADKLMAEQSEAKELPYKDTSLNITPLEGTSFEVMSEESVNSVVADIRESNELPTSNATETEVPVEEVNAVPAVSEAIGSTVVSDAVVTELPAETTEAQLSEVADAETAVEHIPVDAKVVDMQPQAKPSLKVRIAQLIHGKKG